LTIASEDSFLQQLFPLLGTMPADVVLGPGDDCAALDIGGGRIWLLGIDQVVGERHYRQHGAQATPPELVGRKLLARNLSDIAAMGGEPRFALVSIAMADTGDDQQWLLAFHRGLLELAQQHNLVLIGGDLAQAPHDCVASLTIIGEAVGNAPICRHGAAVGDQLFLTGCCGDSFASGHHLHFQPRTPQGAWLARQQYASAMIDISDGLLLDARRLAAASAVQICLDVDAVPRRHAQVSRQALLADGEDYELLFTVNAAAASALLAAWPFADVALSCIGHVDAGPAGVVIASDGSILSAPGGFDHFRRIDSEVDL